MENNFIQMAVSAGHAVSYTIGPIFKHIIDYMQLYFNCVWLVGVTIIFDGTRQRCQIAVPMWPNDISSEADNTIFKNRAQNIDNFTC